MARRNTRLSLSARRPVRPARYNDNTSGGASTPRDDTRKTTWGVSTLSLSARRPKRPARRDINNGSSSSRGDGDDALHRTSAERPEDDRRKTVWGVPNLYQMMKASTSVLLNLSDHADEGSRRHSLGSAATRAQSSGHNAYTLDPGGVEPGLSMPHMPSRSSSDSESGRIESTGDAPALELGTPGSGAPENSTAAGDQGSGAAEGASQALKSKVVPGSDGEVSSSSISGGGSSDESESSGDEAGDSNSVKNRSKKSGAEDSSSGESSSESSSSGESSSGESGSEESSSGESGSEESSSGESSSDDSSSDGSSSEESSSEEGSSSEESGAEASASNPTVARAANAGPDTGESAANGAQSSGPAIDSVAADAGLLLAFSQSAAGDTYTQALVNEANKGGPESFVGPGSAADLMVLDYLSHQVLGEVGKLAQLLEGPGAGSDEGSAAANEVERQFGRLDSLAREHVLVRRNHFTHELFLANEQRPSDEADVVQWAVTLHRANLATFALLVFRPHVAVVETVSQQMPNRERLLTSLGLAMAAGGFFTHIVPASRRDADAVGLLVDMQTQQWLMAADHESHLQAMVASERQSPPATIASLLAVDSAAVADDAAAAMYRSELGRRLNKISGGRLAITRAQFSLHDVWRRAARFCSECAAAMPPPALLSLRLRDADGAEDDYGGSIDDGVEVRAEGESPGEQAPGSGSEPEPETEQAPPLEAEAEVLESEPSIAGDFEVTIFTGRASKRAKTGADVESDAGPIDPSFSEERRLAVVLRDALDDVHLDELMQHIDAEHIDVGADQPSTRTPRRMLARRSHQTSPPPEFSLGADDGFQLQFDDEGEGNSDSDSSEALAATGGTYNLRRGKRAAPNAARGGGESGANETEVSASDLMRSLAVPAKRTRIRYDRQHAGRASPAEFRGRRGIAAEDPASLRAAERVAFTPSPPGTPEPASAAELAALGQYKPLRLEPRRVPRP
ncbi:hypothetical protein IWW54_005127, partial [Coemansia sp. RSA 2705]